MQAIFFNLFKKIIMKFKNRNYLLKIPDPTKHPSTPSCISREQSAGVANPPAAKFTTGSRPKRAVSFKRSRGA